MQKLSQQFIANILFLLNQGHSVRKIASSTGVCHTTVLRLSRQHPSTSPRPSAGWSSKLLSTNIRHAACLISSSKADTAVDVTKTLQLGGSGPVSTETVRKELKKFGMKAVVKCKQPFLSKKHQIARLDFAEKYQYWTVEDWKRVVWSDETKISRMGSDGRKWVWKQKGEGLSERLVQGTQKFGGGSLMLWRCFQ